MKDLLSRCREAIERNRKLADGNDPEIVYFPPELVTEIVRAVAGATTKEVMVVAPLRLGHEQQDGYAERVWRQLARKGVKVRKILVVPHRTAAHALVEQLLSADAAASVTTLVVSVPDLVRHNLIEPVTQVVLDRTLVIREPIGAENGVNAQWSGSRRVEDVSSSIHRWEEVWLWASHRSDTDSLSLEEPLILSADLVSGVADVLCTADHVDNSGCGWYHGAWQYMRLFDLVSTPSWHDSFYRQALEEVLPRATEHGVLITGTADYSVLAYVLNGLDSLTANIPVRVLDRCPTPLFACRWYARLARHTIQVIEADIFDCNVDKPASVIVTDAFLTRFSPVDAARVIARWRELLLGNGFVITTVRIHDSSHKGQSEEDAIRSFSERALLRGRRWASFLKRAPEEIVVMAETYARRMKSNVLGTEREIYDLFSKGGFRVLQSERVGVPGELWPSTYLRILAQIA